MTDVTQGFSSAQGAERWDRRGGRKRGRGVITQKIKINVNKIKIIKNIEWNKVRKFHVRKLLR